MCYSCLGYLTNLYSWFFDSCFNKNHSDDSDELYDSNKENNNDNYLRFSIYEMKKKDLIDNEICEINKNNEMAKKDLTENEICEINKDNEMNRDNEKNKDNEINKNEWEIMEKYDSNNLS